MERRLFPLALKSMLLVGSVLLLSAASCPPRAMDPETRQAFYANEATKHVETLQSIAIAANEKHLISDADAVLTVRFTVAAAKTIKSTPMGWLASTKVAYAELKLNLPPPVKDRFAEVFALIDTVLVNAGATAGVPR